MLIAAKGLRSPRQTKASSVLDSQHSAEQRAEYAHATVKMHPLLAHHLLLARAPQLGYDGRTRRSGLAWQINTAPADQDGLVNVFCSPITDICTLTGQQACSK